jgi:hypothetical protein
MVNPRKPSSTARRPKADSAGGETRTSSRSAKRRSPKEPEPDPELMELERLQFLRAMDSFKRRTGKTFPTWTEVLEVLRSIGWMSAVQLEQQKTVHPG